DQYEVAQGVAPSMSRERGCARCATASGGSERAVDGIGSIFGGSIRRRAGGCGSGIGVGVGAGPGANAGPGPGGDAGAGRGSDAGPGPGADAGPGAGAGESSRYPTPQTVTRRRGSAGSSSIFSRRRRTCTVTVDWSP